MEREIVRAISIHIFVVFEFDVVGVVYQVLGF